MKFHSKPKPREEEIIWRLGHCYRLTTPKREARRYGISVVTARKVLDDLTENRWLCRLSAWVADIPPITEPLFEWNPGDCIIPDFGAIAEAAQARFRHSPVRQTAVYLASKKGLL